MKIGVIGCGGYVGKAMARLLSPTYQVIGKEIGHPIEVLTGCKIAVICVPTNMTKNGDCDISIVDQVIRSATGINSIEKVLIKSTVPPGTCESLSEKYGVPVTFSPEYIGESKYQVHWWEGDPHPTDMKYHNFMIFGGRKEDTSFFVDLFAPIMGPSCKFYQTDSRTAELVKYMENSFYATKVSFCNEFARIAEAVGCDYNEVRELWLADQRVNRNHTMVFKENPGFGGKCLPKDISAIANCSEEYGYSPRLLWSVIAFNEEIREGKEAAS